MSIVIKEILVRTKVVKSVYQSEELPEELIRRLKRVLLEEIEKSERRKTKKGVGKER